MNWVSLGAAFGGLSVMLGAFGAHGLKNVLSEQKLSAFHTATQYMGYHGLALVLVGILCIQLGEEGARSLKKIGMLFTAGIVMFSGSIYALTFGGPRFFGPLTPLGGLCFMIGWFTLAAIGYKSFKKN